MAHQHAPLALFPSSKPQDARTPPCSRLGRPAPLSSFDETLIKLDNCPPELPNAYPRPHSPLPLLSPLGNVKNKVGLLVSHHPYFLAETASPQLYSALSTDHHRQCSRVNITCLYNEVGAPNSRKNPTTTGRKVRVLEESRTRGLWSGTQVVAYHFGQFFRCATAC